MDVTVLSISLA
jgi:hypothetical protein